MLRKVYGILKRSFFIYLLLPSFLLEGQLPVGKISDYLTKSGLPCFKFEVLARYSHDASAFTQGLLFSEGMLYESTGLYGESSLRCIEPKTGKVLRSVLLDGAFFGEGLTLWNGKLVQLTWREGVVLFWDLESFKLQRVVPYPFEGWGLTFDGESFIASDGSSVLRFLKPEDLSVVRELVVQALGKKIERINELEYALGKIYANLWYEDVVIIINPQDGKVEGWLDFSPLRRELGQEAGVMNGIAFDPESDSFYLTGKNWPWVYRVKVKG